MFKGIDMISTDIINSRQREMALCRLKVYFESLPIDVISIDTEEPIRNTVAYKETVGLFFKREVDRVQTVLSYKMLFKHNGQKYHLYLDEDIMFNSEALLNSLRFQLGLR